MSAENHSAVVIPRDIPMAFLFLSFQGLFYSIDICKSNYYFISVRRLSFQKQQCVTGQVLQTS